MEQSELDETKAQAHTLWERVKELELERNHVPVWDGYCGSREEHIAEAQRILSGEGVHLGIRRDVLNVITKMAQSAWSSWIKAHDLDKQMRQLEDDADRRATDNQELLHELEDLNRAIRRCEDDGGCRAFQYPETRA